MTDQPGTPRPRRSLILAGGGYKVAYQAGVLQVWLDEAGLEFDHVDGASGGNLNLAMMCQGMSGTQIATNWRTVAPISGVGLNWREWPKLIYARSLLTYDRFRKNVLPAWGIDWDKIRATSLEATFNLYDFTHNRLESRAAADMSEEMLVASITLPMWFPPVVTPDATYIDAVFLTDGNIEEALRRGADEIWVIWTVSQRGEWMDGFVGDYFGIIETVANGNLQRVLDRIDASNAAIEGGGNGEFGRPVSVKMLKAEVPLHYLVILGSDRVGEAVNQGVLEARLWCLDHGIPLREPAPLPADRTRFHFRETMSGQVVMGATTSGTAADGNAGEAGPLTLSLDIDVRGLVTFLTDPQHPATVTGTVQCDLLGGDLPITSGRFNLLVDDGDPGDKRFRYHLEFLDTVGHPLTLHGEKVVHDDPGFDVWSDTSTLPFRIFAGHDVDVAAAEPIAAGIVHISVPAFLRELTTFNVQGGSVMQRAGLLARFGRLFFGKLWDVYLRRLLPFSPI